MPKESNFGKVLFQLKIELKGIKPLIWRRVLVLGNISLHKLHLTIQTTMGWTDTHLYAFAIHGGEFALPDEDSMSDFEDSRKTKLWQVVAGVKDHFDYVYDFGDNWEHRITVEKITPPYTGEYYPVCVAGARSVPPEDCGGIWGYRELQAILADPKHPDYEKKKAELGEYFEPEEYDEVFINGALREMK